MTTTKSIHEECRAQREDAGVSQQLLATMLNIGLRSLQGFEAGDRALPRRVSLTDWRNGITRSVAWMEEQVR